MLRWTIVLICAALLLAGGIARIGLAAHWPSDVALSYLIGFLWATLLMWFG
jgi:membrane-associated phospholipid phosphatase